MPGLIGRYDGQPREIMVANEEGIIVEHLSAGWLVVGIVQPYQGVSQECSELPASVGRFVRSARGLDDLSERSPCLQLGIAIVIKAAGPRRSFAIGKQRPRHLEFPQLVGQGNQSLRGRLSL